MKAREKESVRRGREREAAAAPGESSYLSADERRAKGKALRDKRIEAVVEDAA